MGAMTKKKSEDLATAPESRYTPAERAEILSTMVVKGEQLSAVTATYAQRQAEGISFISALEAQREQFAEVVQRGNMKPAEGMLLAQAVTLNAIFAELATRAAENIGVRPDSFERYMRLALKAQSQSRTTLETLAEVKSPFRGAYVRQANFANGHQQVNNGREENESAQNELKGDFNVVDTGTQAARIGTDAPAATVAQIHGTAHRRRKVAIQPKRMEGRRTAHAARTR